MIIDAKNIDSKPGPLGKNTGFAASQERRTLQRTLQYEMQLESSQVLGRSHRVSSCQKVPTYADKKSGKYVRGISLNSNGSAHFNGVSACGDSWCCPVCSQKNTEAKRREIMVALKKHRETGGICVLVTLTFSHSRNDVLATSVKSFSLAQRKLKAKRAYKDALKSIGYVGQIRALEITHGNANGWHPHAHEIWFLEKSVTPREIHRVKRVLFNEWKTVIAAEGLGVPNYEHGVDIQYRTDKGADAVGAYIAKWGFELTYSHRKNSKAGRSPFQILKDLTTDHGWRDMKLWKEYCSAYFGKAQLFWSRGLKAMFSVKEHTDIELANMPESVILRSLTREEWGAIVRFRAQAIVLTTAEFKPEKLDSLIDYLVEKKATEKRENELMRKTIIQHTKASLDQNPLL